MTAREMIIREISEGRQGPWDKALEALRTGNIDICIALMNHIGAMGYKGPWLKVIEELQNEISAIAGGRSEGTRDSGTKRGGTVNRAGSVPVDETAGGDRD